MCEETVEAWAEGAVAVAEAEAWWEDEVDEAGALASRLESRPQQTSNLRPGVELWRVPLSPCAVMLYVAYAVYAASNLPTDLQTTSR